MFAEAIAARAVGQYPISIATSLALESAAGIHPELPQTPTNPPIAKFDQLWINVRTLFRNFLGALDKETVRGVQAPEIALTLFAEMDTIRDIVADISGGRCKVVFYVSNYAGLNTRFRHAVLRMDTTERQKEYTAIQTQTLELMFHQQPQAFKGFHLRLRPENQPRAMIITHYAYDLASHDHFGKLVLLESHTGAIKEFAQWYTKYYEGKSLSMIPFREDFLQLFGDAETFRPFDIKLRKELIDIATKYKWTAVTTKAKILYGIDTLTNPYWKATLKDMLIGH
ncbi:hypothetical protein D3C71_79100 [compost metagenome]